MFSVYDAPINPLCNGAWTQWPRIVYKSWPPFFHQLVNRLRLMVRICYQNVKTNDCLLKILNTPGDLSLQADQQNLSTFVNANGISKRSTILPRTRKLAGLPHIYPRARFFLSCKTYFLTIWYQVWICKNHDKLQLLWHNGLTMDCPNPPWLLRPLFITVRRQ